VSEQERGRKSERVCMCVCARARSCMFVSTHHRAYALQQSAILYSFQQRIATHRNTLQHTSTHFNTHRTEANVGRPGTFLRCLSTHTLPATNCNTLQYTATICNILPHTATCCKSLQHTATHCNTLQHYATGQS